MYVNVLIGYIDPDRGRALNASLQREAPNELQIASQTARLADVLWKASQSRPDVLLLEHDGGAVGSIQLLSAVRQVSPASRTLVMHDGLTPEQTIELVSSGASGAVLRSSDDALICKAVRAVHQGQVWFDRIALLQAIQHLLDGAPVAALFSDESLTPREREILRCIGLGLTNKEIARQLDISDNTVKTHLHRIYVKLKLSGRYKAYLAHPGASPSPMPIHLRYSQLREDRPEPLA